MPLSLMSDYSERCSTTAAKTCKFCRRSSDSENPLRYKSVQQPFLAWRRPQGRECGICPWVIESDEWLSSMTKEKLEETLQDDAQHSKFMEKVGKWETFKNLTEGGKTQKSKLKAKTTVTARNSSYFEAKKFLGILWPAALYVKQFGKKPKRCDIGSYPVNGQQIKGVLRPRSEGEIPGTYEIHTVSQQGADLQAVLADTDDMDNDEVAAVFASAQKRQRITAMNKKGKDGEVSVVLKGGAMDDDNDDSSGDDAVFNSVWGERFKNKAELDSDAEEVATVRAAKKPKPTAEPGAAASSSVKPKPNPHADPLKPTAVKSLAKEIDTAEQVLLSVTQLKGLLGDEQRLGKARLVRI